MEVNIDRALQIHGFMPRHELTWLATQATKCQLIVEIGCFRGRSTRAMADNMPEGGCIYAIDTWEGSESIKSAPSRKEIERVGGDVVRQQFWDNLNDHMDGSTVVDIKWNSQKGVPPVLTQYLGSVDMLFIDGDHARMAVANDIQNFRPLVRDGGIISGDDYLGVALPGLRKTVDELFPQRKLHGRIWYIEK